MNGFDAQSVTATTRVALADRASSGLVVTLLWAEDTDSLAVRVSGEGMHDVFEVPVDPGTNPLDVFEHPYAYAAWRGIDYQPELRRAA